MTGLVIFVGVLLLVWGVAVLRQPRRAAGEVTAVPATDAAAWRALVRPVRFAAPVAYGVLGSAIRDSVAADRDAEAPVPGLVQRALDSQTTTFAFGTGDRRLFVATVVCEPEGTGSRGRLVVTTSSDEVADPVQHRALRQLRAEVAEGVSRVGGHLRDAV